MTRTSTSSQDGRPTAVLLSIKTRHVKSIQEGKKTHELRRKIPRNATGLNVFIYSSGEDKAITMHAEVAEVAKGTPEEIWHQYSSVLGITRDEYDDYFSGTDVAYALRLTNINSNLSPVTLVQLRQDYGIEPPQSWRYLPPDSYALLFQSAG